VWRKSGELAVQIGQHKELHGVSLLLFGDQLHSNFPSPSSWGDAGTSPAKCTSRSSPWHIRKTVSCRTPCVAITCRPPIDSLAVPRVEPAHIGRRALVLGSRREQASQMLFPQVQCVAHLNGAVVEPEFAFKPV